MVKNVIFDLGGVVLEWNPDRILASYYADPEMRTIMKTALFLHPDWLQLDRGTLNEAESALFSCLPLTGLMTIHPSLVRSGRTPARYRMTEGSGASIGRSPDSRSRPSPRARVAT